MREVNKKQDEKGISERKMPYNLRERKIVKAPYREMIRAELAYHLDDEKLNIIVARTKYK